MVEVDLQYWKILSTLQEKTQTINQPSIIKKTASEKAVKVTVRNKTSKLDEINDLHQRRVLFQLNEIPPKITFIFLFEDH